MKKVGYIIFAVLVIIILAKILTSTGIMKIEWNHVCSGKYVSQVKIGRFIVYDYQGRVIYECPPY